MSRTKEERAWGFSEREYVDAFSRIYPRELAEREVSALFSTLEENQEDSIGGEAFLFALLSMVSADCKVRVQKITQWSDKELLDQQRRAVEEDPEGN
jgi:hypothetical protein